MSEIASIVEYREIPGWPGYRVGSDGSVWSAWIGKGRHSRIGSEWKKRTPVQETRPKRTGHLVICLKGNGKCRNAFVHTLVLEAFVCPKPDGLECRHINGNPLDNTPGNLCWGTKKQNMDDQKRHGVRACGTRHGNGKLSREQVDSILADRRTHDAIALGYGVSRQHITSIKNGVRRSVT